MPAAGERMIMISFAIGDYVVIIAAAVSALMYAAWFWPR